MMTTNAGPDYSPQVVPARKEVRLDRGTGLFPGQVTVGAADDDTIRMSVSQHGHSHAYMTPTEALQTAHVLLLAVQEIWERQGATP